MVKPHVRRLLDDFAAAGVFGRWESVQWKASDFGRDEPDVLGVDFYFRLPDETICEDPHYACDEESLVGELVRMANAKRCKPFRSALQAALMRYHQAEDIENPPVAWGSP